MFRFIRGPLPGLAVVVCAILAALSPVDADVPELDKLKEAAQRRGKLALEEFESFRGTFLSDLTIETPHFSARGSITGTSKFAATNSRLLLQYVEPGGGQGQWMLAVKLPVQRLSDICPLMRGTPVDEVTINMPVLVFAQTSIYLHSSDLDDMVRDFYAEAIGDNEFELRIEDGVNLLTTAQASGDVRIGAEILGIEIDRLFLQGVILKNFDANELNEARKNRTLAKAMGRSSILRARLDRLELKGLPQEFQVRDFWFVLTGDPSAGLEFQLTIGREAEQRDFHCLAQFQSGGGARKSVTISAQSDVQQPWNDAFGLQGLQMSNLTLEIRYERNGAAPPTSMIGVGGNMRFGEKSVEVVGGLQSKAGVLIGFFKGSINSITRDDLVAIVNDLHSGASGQPRDLIDAQTLPEFEIRNASLVFAPAGGSAELGIKKGVGMKGELLISDKPLGQIDLHADPDRPFVKMNGRIQQFAIGELEMQDCTLDVLLAKKGQGHFRFTGGARVMDISANAEAELEVESTMVRCSGSIADSFAAEFLFRTPSMEHPAWDFEAAFADDFTRLLGQRAAEDIRAWAKTTKSQFDRASVRLENAKDEVARLNKEIARARQQVESERARHKEALVRAESDVRRINDEIARAKRQVEAERQQARNRMNAAERKVQEIQQDIDAARASVKAARQRDLEANRRDLDKAKKSYDAAKRAFTAAERAWKKERNVLKKAKKKATMEAKRAARKARKTVYQAARKKYDAHNAVVNRVSIDADPKIVALRGAQRTAKSALQTARDAYQATTRNVSVDNDPRVAGLLASRNAALAAVRTAQDAFQVAHRISVDADPRVAGLIAARGTAMLGLDAAQGAVEAYGDSIQIATRVLAATSGGDIITVTGARLKGSVGAFGAGGQAELVIQGRVLKSPRTLQIAVSSVDFENGNVFKLAGNALKKPKSAE